MGAPPPRLFLSQSVADFSSSQSASGYYVGSRRRDDVLRQLTVVPPRALRNALKGPGMDYQCVVVYTVIRIPEPFGEDWKNTSGFGCVGWVRKQVKRCVLFDVYRSKGLTGLFLFFLFDFLGYVFNFN